MNLISNLLVTDSIKITFGVFCKYLYHLLHCPISSGYNKWHVCTSVLFNSLTRLIKIKPISPSGKMHVSSVSFSFSPCRKLQNIRIAKSNKLGQNELEFLSGSIFSFVICSRANFKLIHFFISYRFRQQLYDQHVLKHSRRCYYHSSQSNHEHAKNTGKALSRLRQFMILRRQDGYLLFCILSQVKSFQVLLNDIEV